MLGRSQVGLLHTRLVYAGSSFRMKVNPSLILHAAAGGDIPTILPRSDDLRGTLLLGDFLELSHNDKQAYQGQRSVSAVIGENKGGRGPSQ